MIIYKSAKDIEHLRKSGEILAKVHGEIAKQIRVGENVLNLDKLAEKLIRNYGAKSSFLNYRGYPATLCVAVNHEVVHGIPKNYLLQEGDIVTIDCGVCWAGYHTDSAYTYSVGKISEEKQKLLFVTYEALRKGIEAIEVGNKIGEIGKVIYQTAKNANLTVIKEFSGHGIGKFIHENPDVFNYHTPKTDTIRNGLVMAVEPIFTTGNGKAWKEDDGWTVTTEDQEATAHFEQTILVEKGRVEVLTPFTYIEQHFVLFQ